MTEPIEQNSSQILQRRRGELQVVMDQAYFQQQAQAEQQQKKRYVDRAGQEVSQAKVDAMQAYARELRRKHPTMKPERIQRKTAEQFKIKL